MGGGGLSPGTTQFFRCLGQSLRWHSLLQYRTSLQRAQGLNLIYRGAFAPAPMFSFARKPQASQRSLGQPWLFIFCSRCAASTIRVGVSRVAALDFERLSEAQACSLGESATASASLHLVRLLPANVGCQASVRKRLAAAQNHRLFC